MRYVFTVHPVTVLVSIAMPGRSNSSRTPVVKQKIKVVHLFPQIRNTIRTSCCMHVLQTYKVLPGCRACAANLIGFIDVLVMERAAGWETYKGLQECF